MRVAIDRFLVCTANWTPRWFNKPKFHLLLHLPDHVERFGPAILFATEGFESFNAVIRDHSVYSNRQAPSRDIAVGFAHANRIRLLVSGGSFQERNITTSRKNGQLVISTSPQDPTPNINNYKSVGQEPLGLINIKSFGARQLKIPAKPQNVDPIEHGRFCNILFIL